MAHYTSLLQSLLHAKWLLCEPWVVLDLLMPHVVGPLGKPPFFPMIKAGQSHSPDVLSCVVWWIKLLSIKASWAAKNEGRLGVPKYVHLNDTSWIGKCSFAHQKLYTCWHAANLRQTLFLKNWELSEHIMCACHSFPIMWVFFLS